MRNKPPLLLKLILALSLLQPSVLRAQNATTSALELGSYLEQVKGQHADFKSAQEGTRAYELERGQGDLTYALRFFSRAQYVDDAQPQIFFQYDKQLITTLEAGFDKTTNFGLSGKFSYLSTQTNIRGLLFGGTTPRNVDAQLASPKIELNFNLWRNLWGRETRSQADATNSRIEAQLYRQTFKQKSILVQAESTYWALALSREAVSVSKAAVERAQKLFEWHQRRANLGLADRADFLQSQAALQARRLDLRRAEDDEVAAARGFNAARGIESADVKDKLLSLNPDFIQKFEIPKRAELRDDVKAAQLDMKAIKAQAEASRQQLLPTLDVFGSVARTNPNLLETSKAYDNSFSPDRPTNAIGLRFSTALDIGTIRSVREGYEREKAASEYSYERKLFDQEKEWIDLTDKFRQAKERLELQIQLEGMQKEKLDYERNRRTNGRTTTQQVLMFELDYEQAQLGRIRTLSEILQLVAQMKLYGEAS